MRWEEIISEVTIKLGKTTPDPDSPSMKMLNALHDMSSENPFNQRQRVLGSAKVEVQPQGNMTLRLSDIQGSGGSGTEALKSLCQLADQFGVALKLSAYGYADTPTDVLVKWYKKHGFSITSKDDDGTVDMVREPA